MLAAAIAIPKTKADPRHRAARHLSRRGLGPVRRDARRFRIGMAREEVAVAPIVARTSDNVRLFAHTFGAAFLFVTVFLA